MGGDLGIETTLPAALEFLERNAAHSLLLVGHSRDISARLARSDLQGRLQNLSITPVVSNTGSFLLPDERFCIWHADDIVPMDEAPAVALKSRRQSSMRIAIEAVRDGHADAALSSGNTGALMAIARLVLRMLEGIDRPAIAAALPGPSMLSSASPADTAAGGRLGGSYMLDLGANVDCTAQHLLQFGLMGAALVSALGGPERPSVGLLNVGEELIKGNEVVKTAADLLRASPLNFQGNVEGNELFKHKTDVIVSDGFVGNVALKTSEGLAQTLAKYLKEEFTRSWATRLGALLAMPVLKRFARRVDHRRYNGAALLGLRGIVFKSHGSADAYSYRHALERAAAAASQELNGRIAQALAETQAMQFRSADAVAASG